MKNDARQAVTMSRSDRRRSLEAASHDKEITQRAGNQGEKRAGADVRPRGLDFGG